MKTILKTIASLTMAGIIASANVVSYAESYSENIQFNSIIENLEIPDFNFNPIMTFDVKPPKDQVASLPYIAEPYELYAGKSSYTLKGFRTTTGKVICDYEFQACRPDYGNVGLQLTLYKREETKFLWTTKYNWSKIDSSYKFFNDITSELNPENGPNIPDIGTMTFTNLNKSDVYCLKIENITKDNSEHSYNSIMAKVTIRDK